MKKIYFVALEVDFEVKGTCPLCASSYPTFMDDVGYLGCDGKRYFFPYRFYLCQQHGIFVWRGNKHELFDLSKRMNQVSRIEPFEPEVLKRFETMQSHMPTLADYKPVKMKCPHCDREWEQHDGYLVCNEKTVLCPSCEIETSKEKAMVI